MTTFKQWLIEEVNKTESEWIRALGNYVGEIRKRPNISDIRTWADLMKKHLSTQRGKGLLADMLPSIDGAIARLPREEQDEAEKLIASIDSSPMIQNQMVAKGYLPTMEKPYRFYTSEQLEEYLAKLMEGDNPPLDFIKRLVDVNRDHFEDLGDEFKEFFVNWYKKELEKLKRQPSPGQFLKNFFRQHGMGE